MNDANIASCDLQSPTMPFDNAAERTGERLRQHSAHRALYPIDTTDGAENETLFEPHADRQVREDRRFYIPDFLSDEEDDANPEAYTAAVAHAKHLGTAERLLGEALNLVGLVLGSLGDEGDRRAMQIDTALRVIEKKLGKAYNRIDKHDTRHTNLFLAYFDLRDKADEGSKD